MIPPLLQVEDLHVEFSTRRGAVRAVRGVSLDLLPGATLGVVGESGSGKSVTAYAVTRLLDRAGRIAKGRILFRGQDLTRAGEGDMRALRGGAISMVFQNPRAALNPIRSVGKQLMDALGAHVDLSGRERRERALGLLRDVLIRDPERRFDAFPHELSGGMCQRVMIAMALACDPKLLIADEPTTALDVTIQAQILDLLRDLRERTGAAIMLITHDLGVVAELAHRVIVMYAGRIVEEAPVGLLFSDPQHPYTLGLLGSIPRLGSDGDERLTAIEGVVPNPYAPPPGCRFSPRCALADAQCRAEQPTLREIAPGHRSACWRAPLDLVLAEAAE